MSEPTVNPRATSRSLTNTAIEALLPGQQLKDDRVAGLSVRRHKSGVSFMLYYRTRIGDAHRPKLGNYPAMTLAMAREVARQMLVKVSAGQDPVADWKTARNELTVDQLWEKCERTIYGNGKAWSRDAKRLYWKRLAPEIGKKRVGGVRYADVAAVHAKLSGTPCEANRAVAVLSRMMTEAERWEMRPEHSNPCANIQRFRETKRRRFATPEELQRLGPLLDAKAAEDPSGVAFLYLLMFSGARPSEIENGTPDQIERIERGGQAVGVLRLDNGKTGQRDVFLPPQAMAVIDRLPKDRTTLTGRKRLPRALWEEIRTAAGCPDLWARDMRRTFATQALSSGVPIGVVGELLGHASTQTTKIYAKLMEDPAHAAAASIAGRMQAMLTGGRDAVGVAVGPGGVLGRVADRDAEPDDAANRRVQAGPVGDVAVGCGGGER